MYRYLFTYGVLWDVIRFIQFFFVIDFTLVHYTYILNAFLV